MATAPAASRRIILSASRRQDLPASDPARLLGALARGEIGWRHPYTKEPQRLRFEPADVFCLALWSKDFRHLLTERAAAIIDPLHPYFLFTVNDCPALEPGLTSTLDERIEQARTIARRYGARRLLWRYDPLAHWVDAAGREQDNLSSFAPIARRMAAFGVDRVVFSFAQIYGKVHRREREAGIRFVDPPLRRKLERCGELAEQAARLGIVMQTCCQPELEGAHPNVTRGRCIDGPLLARTLEIDPAGVDLRPHPSRPGCGCTRSIDVGSYEPCPHGCIYCYANAAARPR